MVVMEKKMQLPSAPQLAKIAALLVLFLLAPLVPSSLRQPYLYLLFNALVITLGVEAGFLAARRQQAPVEDGGVSKPAGQTKRQRPDCCREQCSLDAVSAKDIVAGIDTPATSTIKKKKEEDNKEMPIEG
ncbi:hypothetical protein GQ55_5G290200 [Panicum hallii var. hallii]|uniref:DUF4408 domain-containing protein n=1 Tax=Panicum hallii var. hallii TaxID=1504633 RepID=A0A2T7DLA7_9POAL|nr:hypothetical protein GQ55_5G290200 [Panicum hallii var. hallii]